MAVYKPGKERENPPSHCALWSTCLSSKSNGTPLKPTMQHHRVWWGPTPPRYWEENLPSFPVPQDKKVLNYWSPDSSARLSQSLQGCGAPPLLFPAAMGSPFFPSTKSFRTPQCTYTFLSRQPQICLFGWSLSTWFLKQKTFVLLLSADTCQARPLCKERQSKVTPHFPADLPKELLALWLLWGRCWWSGNWNLTDLDALPVGAQFLGLAELSLPVLHFQLGLTIQWMCLWHCWVWASGQARGFPVPAMSFTRLFSPLLPPHLPRGQAAVCESQLEPSPSCSWDCPQKPSCVLRHTALSHSSGTSSFPAQLDFLREQCHTLPVYHLLPAVSFREMVPLVPFPPQHSTFPQPSLLFVGFFKIKINWHKGHSGTEERVPANSQGFKSVARCRNTWASSFETLLNILLCHLLRKA